MAEERPTVLVVDDEADICELLREILEDEGYRVVSAESGEKARQRWKEARPDLVLLDIWMPDVDGVTLLKEWVALEGERLCPVIMMSGHGTVETAVEATRLGAFDYLEKPLSMSKLLDTLERAKEVWRHRQPPREGGGVEDFVRPVLGRSAAMRRLAGLVEKLAEREARVLFVGEPGSGKETWARWLHHLSLRRDRPFIAIDSGLLEPETAALELFGREEGERTVPGLLEQAHGGVLFLGNVSEMVPEVQRLLVEPLETGTFLRVGGGKPVQVNVRVLSSSRVPLEEEVRKGGFRKDLYFLLAEVVVEVPPLRHHREDILPLVEFYSDYFARREGLRYRRFPVSVQNFLRNYSWPGNIRELRSLVRQLLILGEGREVSVDEVEEILAQRQIDRPSDLPPFFELPLKEAREQFERAYLLYHLERHGGSVAKLAQAIGMERTHLYRKLHALGIKLRDYRG